MQIKLKHFPYSSWAPRLTSKPRPTATRKWPIELSSGLRNPPLDQLVPRLEKKGKIKDEGGYTYASYGTSAFQKSILCEHILKSGMNKPT